MFQIIIFLLWLSGIPYFAVSLAIPPSPQGFQLTCGDRLARKLGGQDFFPDKDFTSLGNITILEQPGLLPILSTLRFFTERARKYCYVFNVIQWEKYLVRTSYYYGGFDGGTEPPVFDQIIEGTKWSTVDTSEDFANGLSSYYEVVVAAEGTSLSVCLARNQNTISHPFISAIEVSKLDGSMYNTTDLSKYALNSIARSSFGDDASFSFPDDPFNRVWNPFNVLNSVVVESKNKGKLEDFWNKPPEKAFSSSITTAKGKPLHIQWPPGSVPYSKYYIALYFQDNRAPSPHSWRVFNVSVNGHAFFKDLNVTTNGVTVYGNEWPLSGMTNITMTPRKDMPVGPIVSASEIFQLLPLTGKTFAGDAVIMEELAKIFRNRPLDWAGDPCLPWENSWTGVRCAKHKHIRVISIDLKGIGLSGTLPETINNLTALEHLRLGWNNLWGRIPEMKSLTALETLHLENNHFDGWIPDTLSELPKLRELFLQNNNLEGQIPNGLWKPGLQIQAHPGNRLTENA